MKAKIIFHNVDESKVKEAKNLGIKEPEPEESQGEVYFDASYIHLAYINKKKSIIVYFPSGSWLLEYDESLWNEIKTHLSKNIGAL